MINSSMNISRTMKHMNNNINFHIYFNCTGEVLNLSMGTTHGKLGKLIDVNGDGVVLTINCLHS